MKSRLNCFFEGVSFCENAAAADKNITKAPPAIAQTNISRLVILTSEQEI
jgi:hypothetical protein